METSPSTASNTSSCPVMLLTDPTTDTQDHDHRHNQSHGHNPIKPSDATGSQTQHVNGYRRNRTTDTTLSSLQTQNDHRHNMITDGSSSPETLRSWQYPWIQPQTVFKPVGICTKPVLLGGAIMSPYSHISHTLLQLKQYLSSITVANSFVEVAFTAVVAC